MTRSRLWVLLTAAAVVVLVLTVKPWGPNAESKASREEIEKKLREMPDAAEPFRLVAELVSPAVVHINAMRIVRVAAPDYPFDPLLREFFDDDFLRGYFSRRLPRKGYVIKGLGSGFIVSADGMVLTNNHVINEADEVTVGLADGREVAAKLLGADPRTDIALLRIAEKNLPFLKLGDADKLRVGDLVFAFGSPFGLDQTMTSGIVSAKGRRGMGIASYEDFIQTDCAINPGNSGGPLVNIRGEVVGINTAIVSRTGGFQGIGFATPVNMVKPIMEQIIQKGRVVRGWLGVTAGDLTDAWHKRLNIPGRGGVYIMSVARGGPAANAGLQEGDVVVAMDGTNLPGTDDLFNKIAAKAPGDKVTLSVFRAGKVMPVTVTIGEQPGGLR